MDQACYPPAVSEVISTYAPAPIAFPPLHNFAYVAHLLLRSHFRPISDWTVLCLSSHQQPEIAVPELPAVLLIA